MPTAATLDAPADAAAMLASVWRLTLWHANRCAARFSLDADEVAQAAAVAILSQFHRFDPARGSFKRWAWLMTRHAARRMCEARRRRLPPLSLDVIAEDGDPLHEPADLDSDPAALCEAAELRGAVWAAVYALPERERDVVLARYVGGRTHAEQAEAVGVSRQCVSAIEARALRKLAEPISDRAAMTGARPLLEPPSGTG